MVQACSPSNQEDEARGSCGQGQPGLHYKTVYQKVNKNQLG